MSIKIWASFHCTHVLKIQQYKEFLFEMSFWSFSIDISTYIINHLFPTMSAYCPEFNHNWVSKHYIIESSKPSHLRSSSYSKQSSIKTVSVSVSTCKQLKFPRNKFSCNDYKESVICASLSSASDIYFKAHGASSSLFLVSCLIKELDHDALLPSSHTF